MHYCHIQIKLGLLIQMHCDINAVIILGKICCPIASFQHTKLLLLYLRILHLIIGIIMRRCYNAVLIEFERNANANGWFLEDRWV